jgi:SNF2 family DNA or RNA helicase
VKYRPRPPQLVITDAIMRRRRINIWAGMGFGKTGATLDALDRLAMTEDDPILVVGPLNVAAVTWPDELAKWDHLSRWRASPIIGGPKARLAALKVDANLYTVNFENVAWLVDHFKAGKRGSRWPFRTVVFDEATRLQGFRLRQGTAQAAALGKVAHSHVRRWINLTGTPAPNGLKGLWGQNWFIDEGKRLGRTYSAFEDRWFEWKFQTITLSGGKDFDRPILRPTEWAQEEIEERLKGVAISLRARDWFPDLKEPIRNVIKVRLPTKARRHYQEMEKKFFTEIRGHEIEAVHAASKSGKLLQMASGQVYDADRVWHEVHSEKLQALRSVVLEANGANVLVVYQFRSSLERLLKGFNSGELIKSPESIRRWNAGQIGLGFVHPALVGHGQSMQDGGYIIVHFDMGWDMEKFDQINERLGAMRQMQSGYDRDVFEHYIVAEGTMDEDVLRRHGTKRSVQDTLLEAMKARG